jgi:hypothetical protein
MILLISEYDVRIRSTKDFPNDPVPPVTKIDLFLRNDIE